MGCGCKQLRTDRLASFISLKMGPVRQPVIYLTICTDLSWHLLIAGATVHRSRHKIFFRCCREAWLSLGSWFVSKDHHFFYMWRQWMCWFPGVSGKEERTRGADTSKNYCTWCSHRRDDTSHTLSTAAEQPGYKMPNLQSTSSRNDLKRSLLWSIDSSIPNIRLTTRQLHESVPAAEREEELEASWGCPPGEDFQYDEPRGSSCHWSPCEGLPSFFTMGAAKRIYYERQADALVPSSHTMVHSPAEQVYSSL